MNTDTEPPSEPILVAANAGLAIELNDMQAHVSVDRDALIRLARLTLAGEGIERASISIALVDDPTIHQINARHLGHDWPTDVITFVLSDDDELAGELVVSGEMAATTAREAGIDPQGELALYVVHGLLHLCGYDDVTDATAAMMRQREGEVLANAGLINPFSLVGSTPSATGKSEREHLR
jgi:probable rRNA maturation factor